jgi:GR25 family glycosyltransferase involved in LPS biosynthesis
MKIGIFLINLDDRRDRLDSATKQLNEIDLKFTRVSAVSSRDVEENLFLTEPVLACWKSHIKTYSRLIASDLEYALVLEDDFLIKNPKKFSSFLESLYMEQFDLLQIGFLLPGMFNRMRWIFEELEKLIFYSLGFISRNLGLKSLSQRLRIAEARSVSVRFTQSSFLPGTHAYLINRKMALALMSLDSPQFSADEFFIALSKMRSFKMARFWRSLITQSNSAPSINDRFVIRGVK